MSNPIHQHYVPRLYLSRFTDSMSLVYVYDKISKKQYKSSIKNVLQEKDFYTLNILQESQRYDWENYYAKTIEPLFQSLLLKIEKSVSNPLLSSETVIIDRDEQVDFAFCLAMQMLRVPSMRNYVAKIFPEMGEAVISDLIKKYTTLNDTRAIKMLKSFDWNNDNIFKYVNYQAIMSKDIITHIVQNFMQRYWLFYFTARDSFVTNDNPILITDLKIASCRNVGLTNIGSSVIFVISPKICLQMFLEIPQLEALSLNCKRVVLNNEEAFISTVNALQYNNATRLIISNDQTILNHTISSGKRIGKTYD